jgi:hypothetical protein
MRSLKKYQCLPGLWEPELHTNLYRAQGEDVRGGTIFVGSMIDLASVSEEDFIAAMEHCKKYPDNIYLFQSKAPTYLLRWQKHFPPEYMVGTTIETTLPVYNFSGAPSPCFRAFVFAHIPAKYKLVSLEPLMQFDLYEMLSWLDRIKPTHISIGARTGGGPECLGDAAPTDTVRLVWDLLMKFESYIVLKRNLDRILGKRRYEEFALYTRAHNAGLSNNNIISR